MKSSSKIHVAVLFGGRSGEHEVSITSALSVLKNLDPNKYDVTMIGIDKLGKWSLQDSAQLLTYSTSPRELQLDQARQNVSLLPFQSQSQVLKIDGSGLSSVEKPIDVIFPVLHGTFGEDGTVQGFLDLAQIPYVGSGVLGSAVGMDKDVSRRLLKAAGIPVVPTMALRKIDLQKNPQQIEKNILKQFAFPFFVKPANMGSSVGVSKVKTEAELGKALREAFSYDIKVLVEEGIAAREIEIAILGNHEPKASIIGEIIPHHDFYSYEAKYLDENGAGLDIPAKNLSDEIKKQIADYAIQAFKVLECRGFARVDFFLDKKTNALYLNEINTIPGFTQISMYPKLWQASGYSYAQLLDELIKLALENFEERRNLKTSFSPLEEE